jgi:uncharacterized membrane protein YedE/YeeE
MWSLLTRPWPWYVGGPLMGLFVPLLLVIGNKQLGMTSTLRTICAGLAARNIDFFRYDWRRSGLWNVALSLGLLVGAAAVVIITGVHTSVIAPQTERTLRELGLSSAAGLVPRELFSWRALLTVRGAVSMIGGGFLVGFGASYAGGCTSGHGVMGLATRQLASVIALIGIFCGGVFATFLLLPLII